jgi:peptidoglycan/LPS O-acetylase OafA/YrhL
MTTPSTPGPSRPGIRPAALAFAADVACVLFFVTVGRRSHAEGITIAGVAQTAWPFLVGLIAAWLLNRGWRQPTAIKPIGLSVWLSTIVIGMGIRAGTGAGVAPSFIVVATLVTGALLLGWRAAANTIARRSA